MTKAAALHDSSNDSDSDSNSRPRQWRVPSTKLEHISYANWQRFLEVPYSPPSYMHGTVLNDRTRKHTV